MGSQLKRNVQVQPERENMTREEPSGREGADDKISDAVQFSSVDDSHAGLGEIIKASHGINDPAAPVPKTFNAFPALLKVDRRGG